MAKAEATIKATKQGNTKRYCRYNIVTPNFTGSLYVPQNDNNPDELTITLSFATNGQA